ncbi:MAG: YbaB/EbfC family nucleoid-associated protein [Cyclobacteriaceae bacterium]
MFDMMKMMGKVKEVQEKMKTAQEGLGQITVECESGAGMVKATVNGHKEIIKLDIDESLFSDDDRQLMTDLIIAAVNKGIQEADIKAKAHIQEATQGMIPNIPGLDLSGLG